MLELFTYVRSGGTVGRIKLKPLHAEKAESVIATLDIGKADCERLSAARTRVCEGPALAAVKGRAHAAVKGRRPADVRGRRLFYFASARRQASCEMTTHLLAYFLLTYSPP